MKKYLIIFVCVSIALMAAITPFKWKQISDVIPTVIEINYVDGVTAPIQSQLNGTFKVADAVEGYSSAQADAKFARVVLVDNVQHSLVNNNVETVVYTGTIPANSIGVNGSFWITGLWSHVNSANTKTIRVKFNNVEIGQVNYSAALSSQFSFNIRNRNSLTSQVGMGIASVANNSFQSSTAASNTSYTFNTAATITVTVTIAMAVGTETASLEALQIVAFP